MRAREFFERQMISQQQMDAAKLQYESAQGRLPVGSGRGETGGHRPEMAKLQWEHTRVTAEISGTVAELNVEEGGACATGTPVGTIIDHSKMKAKVFVPETQVVLIKPGDTVTLTANAWPGRVFPGRVLTVSPLADRQNRQFPVEIIVDNSGGELSAGMAGSAALVTAVEKDTLLIPVAQSSMTAPGPIPMWWRITGQSGGGGSPSVSRKPGTGRGRGRPGRRGFGDHPRTTPG